MIILIILLTLMTTCGDPIEDMKYLCDVPIVEEEGCPVCPTCKKRRHNHGH